MKDKIVIGSVGANIIDQHVEADGSVIVVNPEGLHKHTKPTDKLLLKTNKKGFTTIYKKQRGKYHR